MKGYLPVGDGHSIYFEVIGPKNGKPFVYFHGGPGGSFSERHQQFFNPRKHRVLFFDQRGGGKSTYKSLLKGLTTDNFLNDTITLMDHVEMRKATMVGSSWGSTMALLMGIINPKRTVGIIASSIFLGSKATIDHYFCGPLSLYIPEAYELFASLLPKNKTSNPIAFYYAKIKKELSTQSKNPIYAREFTLLEQASMKPTATRNELIKEWSSSPVAESIRSAAIECHFMAHQCFLEENFILNNARRLSRFPVTILHGRHDLGCPIEQAYQLHKKIKKSTFVPIDAGHSTRPPAYTKAVKKAIGDL
jgi:proline iminopeptidase